MSQTLTAKTSVIFQADTKEHMINSSFLLGTLIEELDTKDIFVSVFFKDNKKECEDIINHFKIDSKNVNYSENVKASSLFDKTKEIAKLCCKNKIHVIVMPNTPADLNANPQEISEFVGHKALDECIQITKEFVHQQKPKTQKEFEKLENEHRVQPLFKFAFMDDEYIYNNRDKFGLKKFFPDEIKPVNP